MALPTVYLGLMIVAAALYVSRHGGLAGDYVVKEGIAGTLADTGDLADAGHVLFNRWRLPDESDSRVGKVILYLGFPAFLLAALATSFVGWFSVEMNQAFPFGLSFVSYRIVIGIPLALIQWYCIGRLVDRFRETSEPTQRAARET